MTSTASRSPTSLFGLELAKGFAFLLKPWRTLNESAAFAWLAPRIKVTLLQADGQASLWVGLKQLHNSPVDAVEPPGAVMAVELPDDLFLHRRFTLPQMGPHETRQALELNVHAVSPFAPDDLVWGTVSRVEGALQQIDVVLASRRQVEVYLGTLADRFPDGIKPEIWARLAPDQPIVFGGFGEERRTRIQASRWRVNVSLLVLFIAVLAMIAATPTLQLRLRTLKAVAAFDEMARKVNPLIQQRERIVKASAEMATLSKVMFEHVDVVYVLDYLTRVIPDDTSLLSLSVQGNKVSMTGMTGNAAALMQRLSTQPGMRDVRAPTPATRPLGSPKETFSIELVLVAPPAAPSQSTSVHSTAPVASASSAPAPTSQLPSPGSGFTVGGR